MDATRPRVTGGKATGAPIRRGIESGPPSLVTRVVEDQRMIRRVPPLLAGIAVERPDHLPEVRPGYRLPLARSRKALPGDDHDVGVASAGGAVAVSTAGPGREEPSRPDQLPQRPGDAGRERPRVLGDGFARHALEVDALQSYDERGMQAASELRGEFAVIIADERQQAMIAIRDRFGIKPLYYSVVNGEVFFASEIKALLALGVPAAWDLEGATGGAGRSHEKTEFAGISTVPQGCYAIARHGEVRIYPYWDWEIPTAEEMRRDTRSEAEVVVTRVTAPRAASKALRFQASVRFGGTTVLTTARKTRRFR
jgi:hypothetical protein